MKIPTLPSATRSTRAPLLAAASLLLLLANLPTPAGAAADRGGPAVPDSTVVATVGNDPITAGELRQAYALGAGIDREQPPAQLRQDLLDRLVHRELLVQGARRRGLERTQSLVRFRRALESKLAADELRNRIYAGKVEVSEEEIAELYERYYDTFRVLHLSVDTRARAEELHRRLEEGEDFGDLARRFSEDRKTGAKGGDMGDITAGILVIEFEDAVFDLEPGEITPVIKGKGEHYKIFKLLSRRRDRTPPKSLEEMRPALEQRVITREGGAALYDWQLEMLDRYHFEIDETTYARFAEHLRDNIATWEAVLAVDPDSLSKGWIFTHWAPELQRLELARFDGGRLTVAEFLANARDMQVCPTCLWRDSDVQLRQQVRGMAFDTMFELEIRDIKAEHLPWIQEELERRTEDRLVDMMSALLRVREGSISDTDVQAYLQALPEPPLYPAQTRARRIIVDTEEQALDIRERLEGGADFATLAERFSIDERTNYKGGDTGFFGPGTLEGMADVAFQHEVGDLVGPFETRLGWEIVEILERQPERPATFDEAKQRVRQIIADERSDQAVLDLVETLRRRTPITIHEDVLARLTLDPAS